MRYLIVASMVTVGCADTGEDLLEEVEQAEVSAEASLWAGYREGTAVYLGSAPVCAGGACDHGVRLWVSCDGTRGRAEYEYPAFGVTCVSDLVRTSVSADGLTAVYADTTQTPGCTDGRVTLDRYPSGARRFSWDDGAGGEPTEGPLTLVRGYFCW